MWELANILQIRQQCYWSLSCTSPKWNGACWRSWGLSKATQDPYSVCPQVGAGFVKEWIEGFMCFQNNDILYSSMSLPQVSADRPVHDCEIVELKGLCVSQWNVRLLTSSDYVCPYELCSQKLTPSVICKRAICRAPVCPNLMPNLAKIAFCCVAYIDALLACPRNSRAGVAMSMSDKITATACFILDPCQT